MIFKSLTFNTWWKFIRTNFLISLNQAHCLLSMEWLGMVSWGGEWTSFLVLQSNTCCLYTSTSLVIRWCLKRDKTWLHSNIFNRWIRVSPKQTLLSKLLQSCILPRFVCCLMETEKVTEVCDLPWNSEFKATSLYYTSQLSFIWEGYIAIFFLNGVADCST